MPATPPDRRRLSIRQWCWLGIFAATVTFGVIRVWLLQLPMNPLAIVEPRASPKTTAEEETAHSLDRIGNSRITGTGTVSGVILFEGEPPDPEMLTVARPQQIRDESLIVDKNTGGIANAIIYLPTAPKSVEFRSATVETTTARISDRAIEPRVMIVRPGQPVEITNGQLKEQVYKTLDWPDSARGGVLEPAGSVAVSFRGSGHIPGWIECACEGWKKSHALVLDHPYGAISDRKGNFKLNDLPAGTHKLRIWHERAGWLEKDFAVDVVAGREASITLRYAGSRFDRQRQANGPTAGE